MEPPTEPAAAGEASRAHGRRTILVAGLTGISGIALSACSSDVSGTPAADATAGGTTSPAAAKPTSSGTAGSTTTGSGSRPSGPPRVALTSGADITHGPATGDQVALTFHGQGPEAMAREILDICAKADAAVTVFAVGTWLTQYPHLGREILAGGHELGNHTWSHQQMKQLTRTQATDEAVRGAAALKTAVGTAGWWFRPSGTQRSTPDIRAAAATAGYHRCVSYDVDPEDFRDPGAAAVRRRTLEAVRPGSIVSLHFGHPGTVEALPAILTGLRTRQLKAVHLTDLLRSV